MEASFWYLGIGFQSFSRLGVEGLGRGLDSGGRVESTEPKHAESCLELKGVARVSDSSPNTDPWIDPCGQCSVLTCLCFFRLVEIRVSRYQRKWSHRCSW